MASPLFSIPRFLLPQSGLIWRRANLGNRLRNPELLMVRNASSTATDAKSKQVVLEKPARFNPPSHGARLPKNKPPQQHYGGSLSANELSAQKKKEYPGLPAADGTWAHWFWNSKALHLCITMSTLASLAFYTAAESFKASSPFTDMLPTASDFCSHPIISFRTTYEVWHLTSLYTSVIVAEKRKKVVDDVAKRTEYRKAHGLEKDDGWISNEDAKGPPSVPGKREKFLGIF